MRLLGLSWAERGCSFRGTVISMPPHRAPSSVGKRPWARAFALVNIESVSLSFSPPSPLLSLSLSLSLGAATTSEQKHICICILYRIKLFSSTSLTVAERQVKKTCRMRRSVKLPAGVTLCNHLPPCPPPTRPANVDDFCRGVDRFES